MGMLSWLITLFSLYAAFLADVTIRSVSDSQWLPNLVLLAAFCVLRTRVGIISAATAGLICDGLADRPLGLTMLTATLAATVCREVTRTDADSVIWFCLKVFVFVAVIECSARFVAETISTAPDPAGAILSGMRVAVTTGIIAIALLACQRSAKRAALPRHYGIASR